MEKIQIYLLGGNATSNSAEAKTLQTKSSFGEVKGEKVQYTLTEAFYLVEKKKAELSTSTGKKLTDQQLEKTFQRLDKKFTIKYPVYKDLREKGYIVKTALKFGGDFRIYEKGKKPGKAHAKWIAFVDKETTKTSWNEFAAKNRVAHSTKKKLLIAVVDEESDVSYYEVSWIKP